MDIKSKIHWITYKSTIICALFKKMTKGKVYLVTRDKKIVTCGRCNRILADDKVKAK